MAAQLASSGGPSWERRLVCNKLLLPTRAAESVEKPYDRTMRLRAEEEGAVGTADASRCGRTRVESRAVGWSWRGVAWHGCWSVLFWRGNFNLVAREISMNKQRALRPC